jgi:hypothetical protein
VLSQRIPLRSPAGGALAHGTRFRVSAWLGGTRTSWAQVRVAFIAGSGRTLGGAATGPAGGSGSTRRRDAAHRRAAGLLPPGTRWARVSLVLRTSLKNADGPYALLVGYDHAVAVGLRFSVTAPVRRPAPLVPPAARVPRYQHVFLFSFENQDYRQLIGDTARASYLNSLLPHASLLANFLAEEHPSDGNYVALAAGSTERPSTTCSPRPRGPGPDAAPSPSRLPRRQSPRGQGGGAASVPGAIRQSRPSRPGGRGSAAGRRGQAAADRVRGQSGSGTVTPISTATGRAGRAIRVGASLQALALTPDGRTLSVLNW